MEALPEHAVEGEGVGIDALAAVGAGAGLGEEGVGGEVICEGDFELAEGEELDGLGGLGAGAHGAEGGAEFREVRGLAHRAVCIPPY